MNHQDSIRHPDPDALARLARAQAPTCDRWWLRHVSRAGERLQVRRDVVDPPTLWRDEGLMVSVVVDGAIAHAASGAVDAAGIRMAFERAVAAARTLASAHLFDAGSAGIDSSGTHRSQAERLLPTSFPTRVELVRQACAAMAGDNRVVDRVATLSSEREQTVLVGDSGPPVVQFIDFIIPDLRATARANGQVQTRSLAGQYNGLGRQGGAEVLDEIGFTVAGKRLADEAIALTGAPNCPTGMLDLLLMPDQMMLQIHESIGHPLELDRILGDERNFAGGSFVTPDMFGTYQYGSELLNVRFEPDLPGELAGYGYDDDGLRAEAARLIERGILMRPLGGALSARRANEAGFSIEPVACSRASNWNRPTIDRMANLNIEAGSSSLEAMIRRTEHGVLMSTNTSWSIDDQRDKFQFGCELGRVIRDGELGPIVRNPGYRGRSANFWRGLAAVGDTSTFERYGTPFCGKGEPMQVVRVGHASPACLFRNVEVFGADA